MRSARRASRTPRLSRRNVLLGAATVGVGGAVVSVASLGEAFDTASASNQAIVVHVRDVKAGLLDVFVGERLVQVHDRELTSRLAKAASKK